MKHDNWKLTAYALGELEGEDRVLMELRVAQSSELQKEVTAIRATERHLGAALRQSVDSISGGATHALADVTSTPSPGRLRSLRLPLSLAATIVVIAGLYFAVMPSLTRTREQTSKGIVNAESDESSGIAPSVSEVERIMERRDPVGEILARATGREVRRIETPEANHHETRFAFSSRAGGGSELNRPQGPIGADNELLVSAGESRSPLPSAQLVEVYRTGEDITRAIKFDFANATASTGQHSSSGFILNEPIRIGTLSEEDREFLRSIGYLPNDPSSSERYAPIVENPFRLVDTEPLSTFSIDVDTASYANIRRFLNAGALPPPDAVRLEEMINYFDYDYPTPADEHPFSVNLEIADCPWNAQHRLARIGIAGYELDPRDRPAANLVFLIDVSGSMNTAGKLPLVQESLSLLIDQLDRRDSIAMVVYAGASGVVLEPTGGANRERIRDAVHRLQAGGSTNGGAGIELAYELASQNFIEGGINRVILATDGDFNVGVTGQGDLQRLIEEKAKSGVFLTVLGFGMGNLQDATLETLADKGNGNYAYIDTLNEAHKVLVAQMGGTLVTIAKDVKIQVEFNPLVVSAYRLIGYENRMLAAQDFNDDRKDAGEIGAGHTVTALYEIVPAGQQIDVPPVDDLKYQRLAEITPAAESGELMTVKLRYKEPDGIVSKLIEMPVSDTGTAFVQSSDDFAFAAAVASFGMLLRGSPHAAALDYSAVAEMAQDALGDDLYGYRAEFLNLVRVAGQISPRTTPDGFKPVPDGSP